MSCLHGLQVTTASWLGAVAFHTGGLVIDHGWVRVFGGGDPDNGMVDILAANQGSESGVLIAVDVLGGQFAWRQSSPDLPATVHYFGPDGLSWQDLECGYAQWLNAMLSGLTEEFYANLRWAGWPLEVAICPLDQGIHTYPPPWSVEGKDLGTVSRRPVPMVELTAYHHEVARQIGTRTRPFEELPARSAGRRSVT